MASLTNFIIPESTVLSPFVSALNFIVPLCKIVPPKTMLPTDLSTGNDSPEIIDSSTVPVPSYTSPSAGILSPEETNNKSNLFTSSMSTSLINSLPN